MKKGEDNDQSFRANDGGVKFPSVEYKETSKFKMFLNRKTEGLISK